MDACQALFKIFFRGAIAGQFVVLLYWVSMSPMGGAKMKYRIAPKSGEQISALGFGGLRLHKDDAQVERQVRYAIGQGVNFFDTAYVYKGSEATFGKIFANDGLRAQVKISTKLPYYMVKKPQDLDRLFGTQLERLRTDYIDYYMVHMLPSVNSWNWLLQMGIADWVRGKRAAGKIRRFGFSFHGGGDDFIALIDAWDWDFCMIQYNYYDENNQAGRRGLDYAAGRGVGIIVMEPLRGGTLVHNLPKPAMDVWKSAPVTRSAADWGLRWVLDQPQVLTVLSGMGSMEMVEENIRIASHVEPGALSTDEFALYDRAREAIRAVTKVACTGCGYCLPCPRGVDIPLCLSSLNDTVLLGWWKSMYWYVATTQGRNASRCNKCGKCEPLCPQGIPIREALGQAARKLERFPYPVMRFVAKRMLKNRE